MMAWVVDFEWKEKAAVETERGDVAAGKPDGRRSSGRGTLNLQSYLRQWRKVGPKTCALCFESVRYLTLPSISARRVPVSDPGSLAVLKVVLSHARARVLLL
jgi:hypothetical protein